MVISKKLIFIGWMAGFLCACSPGEDKEQEATQRAAQAYLDDYSNTYQELYYQSSKAQWKLNTRIRKGDTTNKNAARRAKKALAAFTGSEENIRTVRKWLDEKSSLTPLQIKQLEKILYKAGENPQTAGEVVDKLIEANTDQVENLYGFDFKIEGKSVTPNKIDSMLKHVNDLDTRLKAWSASKEVGKELKSGLVNLQKLRNASVQALGYNDFFAYEVSDYGMTSEEMLTVCRSIIMEIWPLFRELHTWARYQLAEQYDQPVPEMLPAHWLPNRWGQEWTGILKNKATNLDNKLGQHDASWIVKEGEDFYASLGFEPLPQSFYQYSSLYPLPDTVDYKKNNHASAWHLDLDDDVRSLMSVEPNTRWWETTLHELGHIYYYISYSNPDVPIVLRKGANRAYHEAIGSLIGLASLQKPFLEERGLVDDANMKSDSIQLMLNEALNYVVLIPWAAGVMTEFEHELYANELPAESYNKKWWALKKQYLGIVPPAPRGEKHCDAASKTHINNDPAQYYDYALSFILLFQFHDHIANKILGQDPHATNYYGSKATGAFLKELMEPGATVDWREHLKNTIGEEISAKSMVNYFDPLMQYLQMENQGREYTLPEMPGNGEF